MMLPPKIGRCPPPKTVVCLNPEDHLTNPGTIYCGNGSAPPSPYTGDFNITPATPWVLALQLLVTCLKNVFITMLIRLSPPGHRFLTLGDGETETHSSPNRRTEEQNDFIQTVGPAAGDQIMGCPRDDGTSPPALNQ